MTAPKPDELKWRTSSYSGPNGNCVEVAWHMSSYSGPYGDCVEVAHGHDRHLVRDSKNRGGPVLALPTTRWRQFVRGLAR